MLRSQGIPARVVLGFKCDQYNSRRKAYQVRQADAHAWVEAYLAPEKVPPGLRWGDAGRWTRGAWLRLDPTPAADADAGLLARKISAGIDWIESFWSDYVMDMDRQRQNEAIYNPMFAAIGRTAKDMVNLRWWRDRLKQVGRWLRGARWHGLGGWLQHVGLPLAVALAALWLIGRRMGQVGRRIWRRLRERAAAGRRRRSRIDFYRRFETLLARKGLVRPAGQTPRELALRGRAHRRGHRATGFAGAARPTRQRLLPRPLRRPAPGQPPTRSGRTWLGPIGADRMKIGLVGYQGSGKSTLFEWLTGVKPDPAMAHAAQSAMAVVPEPRVEALCKIYAPKKVTLAALELVDTPGLNRSHEGNAARLALIRETGCLVLVAAAFGRSDPLADLRAWTRTSSWPTWRSSPAVKSAWRTRSANRCPS